jgi:hypothetical protein
MDLLDALLTKAKELNANFILCAKPDGDISLGVKAQIKGNWYGDYRTLAKNEQNDTAIYGTLYDLDVSITHTREMVIWGEEHGE